MKVEMSKDVRTTKNANYEILSNIEREIKSRIQDEFLSETTAIRKENENLVAHEKMFYGIADELLCTLQPTDEIKIESQVGPGGSIVNTYVGHLEFPYRKGDKMFNMVSPDKLDGKPFTVGFSCLLSIEKL